MTRRTLAALAALALVPGVAAQQKFRSGVDVVRVDALVTADRRPIAGLRASDFELRDNGVLQTIDSASLESLPLSLIFALDTSGSVAGRRMQYLREAVDLILQGLRDQDRAALVTFSHRIWMRSPLTTDFESLRRAIGATETVGGTSLYDAVYSAVSISDADDSRPVVVVFSDGLDNTSWLARDAAERAARRGGAVIYGVAVPAREIPGIYVVEAGRRLVSGPRMEYVRGQTDFLDEIASATGGRVLKADDSDKLPKAFDEILREFRTRYLITYSPRGVDSAGWHRIELKVKGRRAAVNARAGYQR